MLYDMDFADLKDPKPMFFPASVKNGIVEIPYYTSEEIRR